MTLQRSLIALALASAALPLRRPFARRRARRQCRRSRSGRSRVRSASSIAAQLQRGFKVYREVCQSCHCLSLLSFRNLAEPGGPGFTPAQAAAIAAEYKVQDGPNDAGEMFERAGRPADRFPKPFPNDNAARAANGGALPPDLSVMAKARTYERGGLVVPARHRDPVSRSRGLTISRRC